MTAPTDVIAAGIVIASAGYKRSALDVAREFVREQAMGERGTDGEERDARKLAELLTAWVDPRNTGGPFFPPRDFGSDNCRCPLGTEDWCRAVGCPREPTPSPDRPSEGA